MKYNIVIGKLLIKYNISTAYSIIKHFLNWVCDLNAILRIYVRCSQNLYILGRYKQNWPKYEKMGENQGNRACVIQGRAKIVMCKNCSKSYCCSAFLLCSCHLTRLRNAYRKWTDKPFLPKTFSSSKAQDLHLFFKSK